MKASIIAALSLTALGVAACATVDGPQTVANADTQREECKAVGLTSATQLTRGGNPSTADRTDPRNTQGELALNRLDARQPPSMQTPGGPHNGTISRLARDC